jgi:dihydrolipoamide dehydrogenase
MAIVEVKVPDIGDFQNVDVIEVLVKPGDFIMPEDSLITLESDKATMEVPSPHGGEVKELIVKIGDKVSEGTPILTMEVATAEEEEEEPEEEEQASPATEVEKEEKPQTPTAQVATEGEIQTEVVVLGAGPGGYTAAFRAADLGKQVVLIERYPSLGGVCLNVGCIPSKALLHVAQIIHEAAEMREWGVEFGDPRINVNKLVDWKNTVVGKLTGGLAGLAVKRNVKVIQGVGKFISPNQIQVETAEGTVTVSFEQAIIAAGSQAIKLPNLPNDDPRILDATAALELPKIDGELLVIGGGIIALEMATVYHALGSKVTIAVRSDTLMSGLDKDLVKPLQTRIQKQYENIFFNTQVNRVEADDNGFTVYFSGEETQSKRFDNILVAVGRRSNGDRIGAENAGVTIDDKGFIPVDKQQRTNVPHIFAIGDIIGHPQLAHKASHEGKVAAEVIAGIKSAFDARVIPSVAYTDPEIAWAGLTEPEAKAHGINYGKGVFPWLASGRSLSIGRDEGLTKILFDKDTGRMIGIGITGTNAGELISEGALAIEMGADAQDIGLTIHPHPTLSETVMMAAEAFEGTITDLYVPKSG